MATLTYAKEFLMSSGDKPDLTLGKVYPVLEEKADLEAVCIIDDAGNSHYFEYGDELLTDGNMILRA